MTYLCRISDSLGKISLKNIHVHSYNNLRAYWETRGYILLSSEVIQEKRSLPGRKKAVLEMTRTLTLMVQSGLTLKEAFEINSSLFSQGRTAMLIQGIHEDLCRGESFSQILAVRNALFSPLYQSMIRVGETVGHLDRILPSLTDWLEKEKELKDKIRGALLYPALVMLLVFMGMAALLIFFLPYMEEMVSFAGEETMEELNQASSSARTLILLLTIFVLILLLFYLFSPLMKKKIPFLVLLTDRGKLRIPVLKRFILTRDMLSLNFSLATLTKCGIPLEEALLQAAEIMGNRYLRESLIKVREKLLKGFSLSILFREARCFPPEMANWTALGERTGRVDRVFEQLRGYYQGEMDLILNGILTLAEPVIILFLGTVLTVIIVKVILPLLTLYGGLI